MFRKLILPIILLLHFSVLSAKNTYPIFLSSETKDFILTNKFYELLEDSSNRLNIDMVSSPGFLNQFSIGQEEYNYTKQADATYWIRFQVIDTSHLESKWVLELLSLHTQDLTFYSPNNRGGYTEVKTGQNHPFHQRGYAVTNFVFDLSINKNVNTVFYVKIKSAHMVGFEFKIRSQQYFTFYTVKEYFFLGLYYGILLIMGTYNLLIFIGSKEKVYLFYFLYVLSCMVNSFAEDGLGFQFVWPNSPEWNWVINNYLWSFSFQFFFLMYATQFLELRKNYPKLFYLTLLGFLCYVCTFLAGLNLYVLYLLPFIITYGIGLYVWQKGYKPARFFVLGFSFVFISIIIYQLRIYNLINHTIFTVYSFNFGIVLEVVVLSIALGDRIKHMKAEKEKAQQRTIEGLEENRRLQQKVNKELEEKVTIRTSELLQKSTELEEANSKLKRYAEELNTFASKLDLDNWELNKKVIEETKARILAKEVSYDEFNKIFPTELSCIKYLENLKWEKGYVCRKCGNDKYTLKPKFLSRKCSKCDHIESVLSSTIFHGVKFEITKAFYIVYVTSNKNNPYSLEALAEMLKLSKTTCWKFRNKVLDKEAAILNKHKISKITNWELLIKD
jgi:hypothetical protein